MTAIMTETKFEFDLVFALPDKAADEGTILDSLYEAECDDAVVGLGAAGLVGLGFTRAGRNAEAAISDTVKQVLGALPEGSTLREVKPDLVSLAEVAARLKVTRQALQKRPMPPPSLGGPVPGFGNATLSELGSRAGCGTGFATRKPGLPPQPGAQRINARIGLAQSGD